MVDCLGWVFLFGMALMGIVHSLGAMRLKLFANTGMNVPAIIILVLQLNETAGGSL